MAGGNDIMNPHIPRDNMTLVCSGKNYKSEALHKNIYLETGIMKKTKFLISTETDALISGIKLTTQT